LFGFVIIDSYVICYICIVLSGRWVYYTYGASGVGYSVIRLRRIPKEDQKQVQLVVAMGVTVKLVHSGHGVCVVLRS
jgi:hypothetical protein